MASLIAHLLVNTKPFRDAKLLRPPPPPLSNLFFPMPLSFPAKSMSLDLSACRQVCLLFMHSFLPNIWEQTKFIGRIFRWENYTVCESIPCEYFHVICSNCLHFSVRIVLFERLEIRKVDTLWYTTPYGLVDLLFIYSNLMIAGVGSSETSVHFYQTIRRHILYYNRRGESRSSF
jgi:hypothetical protein